MRLIQDTDLPRAGTQVRRYYSAIPADKFITRKELAARLNMPVESVWSSCITELRRRGLVTCEPSSESKSGPGKRHMQFKRTKFLTPEARLAKKKKSKAQPKLAGLNGSLDKLTGACDEPPQPATPPNTEETLDRLTAGLEMSKKSVPVDEEVRTLLEEIVVRVSRIELIYVSMEKRIRAQINEEILEKLTRP